MQAYASGSNYVFLVFFVLSFPPLASPKQRFAVLAIVTQLTWLGEFVVSIYFIYASQPGAAKMRVYLDNLDLSVH